MSYGSSSRRRMQHYRRVARARQRGVSRSISSKQKLARRRPTVVFVKTIRNESRFVSRSTVLPPRVAFNCTTNTWPRGKTRPLAVYRPIGRYRCSKHRKSPAPLNMTRHLLYVYFRLRADHCLYKRNQVLGLALIGLVFGLGMMLGLGVRVRACYG